jgi:hypothetical protein
MGISHLAADLVLADHHRIEASGDADEVDQRFVTDLEVQVRPERLQR